MSRRTAFVLFVLALLQPSARGTDLRVTSTMGGTLALGQSTPITWTIEGTRDPVRLLLRNDTPTVGLLSGGDVQLVTTSGGAANSVTRSITAVGQGQIIVHVEIEPGRDASPDVIARAFRRELTRVAALIDNEAAELPVERTGMLQKKTVGLEDFLAAIDRIERETRLALPYRELVPFQDFVTDVLDGIRHQAQETAVAGNANSNGIVLIAHRPPLLLARDAQNTLHRLAALFRSTADNSPVGTICIQTIPVTGADVVLYPASFPTDRHVTRSMAPLTLYLGRYQYEVTKADYLASKGEVDLLVRPQRILELPLRRRAQDSQNARLLEGSLERCR